MQCSNPLTRALIAIFYIFAILLVSLPRSCQRRQDPFSGQGRLSRIDSVESLLLQNRTARLNIFTSHPRMKVLRKPSRIEILIAQLYNPEKRRALLGSSPPACTSKCGDCTPCNTVIVPINTGTTFSGEYYPEAWRCQCNNKIYNP
eukprot:c21599_g1_i2 orf=845-1282(+)